MDRVRQNATCPAPRWEKIIADSFNGWDACFAAVGRGWRVPRWPCCWNNVTIPWEVAAVATMVPLITHCRPDIIIEVCPSHTTQLSLKFITPNYKQVFILYLSSGYLPTCLGWRTRERQRLKADGHFSVVRGWGKAIDNAAVHLFSSPDSNAIGWRTSWYYWERRNCHMIY